MRPVNGRREERQQRPPELRVLHLLPFQARGMPFVGMSVLTRGSSPRYETRIGCWSRDSGGGFRFCVGFRFLFWVCLRHPTGVGSDSRRSCLISYRLSRKNLLFNAVDALPRGSVTLRQGAGCWPRALRGFHLTHVDIDSRSSHLIKLHMGYLVATTEFGLCRAPLVDGLSAPVFGRWL